MSKKNILLIDDEKEFITALTAFLENKGYNVLSANDGTDGLQKVKMNPVDLVLLDIMMPGIDGFEILRRLRHDPATKFTPVIMFTAKGDSNSLFKTQDLGSTDYIIKPFDLEKLLDMIKEYI